MTEGNVIKDTDIIKLDLARRAVDSPFIATQVVAKNPVALLGEGTDLTILMGIVSKYYLSKNEPITKETAKLNLAHELKNNPKLKNIDDQRQLNLVNLLSDLIDEPYDSSSSMTDAVSSYVRDKLAYSAILDEASKAGLDNYDLVKSLGDRLADINSLNISGKGDKPVSVMQDLEERENIYKEFNVSRVPSGLAPLDTATNGGLSKGEVGLLAARSGSGKSTFMANLSVYYSKNGYNVFHVSLEELASMMLLRFDRLYFKAETKTVLEADGSIRQSFLNWANKLYSTIDAEGVVGKLVMYKGTPQTITVDKLRQIILSSERELKLKYDVVIVDYPDLLLNKHNTGNESADGGHLFEDLRSLAQELNVVMWTATQLNRTTSSADLLTLDNIEGSYRKKNVVEFAGTINVSKAERDNGYMRIYLDKLRNRMDYTEDTLYLKYNRAYGAITAETEEQELIHRDLVESERTSWTSSKSASNKKKYAGTPIPEAETSVIS